MTSMLSDISPSVISGRVLEPEERNVLEPEERNDGLARERR